jgi:hypothetical protein
MMWKKAEKLCGTCEYYKPNGACFRLPPSVIGIRSIKEQVRPVVEIETPACGEYKKGA